MAFPRSFQFYPAFYKAPYTIGRNSASGRLAGYPNAPVGNTGLVTLLGTADITAAALYGGGGLLNGETLILNVNGAGPLTLNLVGAGNAASRTALLNAIRAFWPALSTSTGGILGNKLVLADNVGGSIVVGAGSANVNLGIAGGAGARGILAAVRSIGIVGGKMPVMFPMVT